VEETQVPDTGHVLASSSPRYLAFLPLLDSIIIIAYYTQPISVYSVQQVFLLFVMILVL
jgi:hypothetical protein